MGFEGISQIMIGNLTSFLEQEWLIATDHTITSLMNYMFSLIVSKGKLYKGGGYAYIIKERTYEMATVKIHPSLIHWFMKLVICVSKI